MGMNQRLERFIRGLNLPKGFSVCDLGSLMMYKNDKAQRPARDFYRELGCQHYDSIDGNGEGTITADLNLPLPVVRQYDLVTDLGTGEHIFDQAQVFQSIHALMVVGGIFVFDRPIQRWVNHGFYNMQPNLIQALVSANCYELIALNEHEYTNGVLAFGAYRKIFSDSFKYPQQGRYMAKLKILEETT